MVSNIPNITKARKCLLCLQNWISDWFGLFDIAMGVITFTAYYPNTQRWWFRICGR